jgi:fructose-1,6-bisphosphatase/sedoheptulose 1,7-bisphosphatase-like protein
MDRTLEIDDVTHASLREIAERDQVTLEEALVKVVDWARRERFFRDMKDTGDTKVGAPGPERR